MNVRVRGKLFLISCALVLCVVLVAGLVADLEIRGFLVARKMPPLDVEQAVARTRALLIVAGSIGVVLAFLMSALASEVSSRAMRELVARTRRRAIGFEGIEQPAEDDEIHALAGTFDHLSRELDRAVAASTGERDRMRAVLEGMQEAVVAVDENARIVLVNRAAHALLSIDGDPRGRPLVDVVRRPALLDAVSRAADGEPARAELTIGAASITAHATPTGARGVVLVLEDVTDVARLERVRRDFVANVSHELRTPVSVIAANAEVLLDGGLDAARAREFLEAIARHADRLSRLIADLLDLSRLESGTSALEPRLLAIGDVCERAAENVRARAEGKRLRLDIDVDPTLSAWADAKALDQVLVNLLDNGVKYTPEGGRIAVRAAFDDAGVAIVVEDDGPGIAPEHRARLFERFYRVDAGRSREMGGTGLGLAIVKHLVEAMHGSVSVESASPHGSRFVVRLPRG